VTSDCGHLRRLADAFLDGELPPDTSEDVGRHLESCPDCGHDMAARRDLRDRLRRGFDASESLQPRPEFASELAARLRPADAPVSRRSVLRSWWALAAGVLIAAGGGVVIRRAQERSKLAALARLAAGDHQNCAIAIHLDERPVPMDQAGRRYGLPYRALTDFVPPTPKPARVLDRHACVYQGHRFAHVVFEHQDGPASLLVIDAPPPSEPQIEAEEDGLQVVSLPAGRFSAFLVIRDPNPDAVRRLAESCVAPLANRLS